MIHLSVFCATCLPQFKISSGVRACCRRSRSKRSCLGLLRCRASCGAGSVAGSGRSSFRTTSALRMLRAWGRGTRSSSTWWRQRLSMWIHYAQGRTAHCGSRDDESYLCYIVLTLVQFMSYFWFMRPFKTIFQNRKQDCTMTTICPLSVHQTLTHESDGEITRLEL